MPQNNKYIGRSMHNKAAHVDMGNHGFGSRNICSDDNLWPWFYVCMVNLYTYTQLQLLCPVPGFLQTLSLYRTMASLHHRLSRCSITIFARQQSPCFCLNQQTSICTELNWSGQLLPGKLTSQDLVLEMQEGQRLVAPENNL